MSCKSGIYVVNTQAGQSIGIGSTYVPLTVIRRYGKYCQLGGNGVDASVSVDIVPESNVDETIIDIQGLFVEYMRHRNLDNLEVLLSTIRKMLSELYMSCDKEEKEVFKKHLTTLQNIPKVNII